MSQFRKTLLDLRKKIAVSCQKVYDGWTQEEDECGGICNEMAEMISNVLVDLPDVDLFEGGHEGDDHAWVIVQKSGEAYGVDIPPEVYETGGGYNWKKKEGVKILADHVVIFPVPLQHEC